MLASGGYPGPFAKGTVIEGLKAAARLDDFLLFHGGTALSSDGKTITNGGRVISAVGLGDTLQEAVSKAYDGVSLVFFENMHYRKDIAKKAFVKTGGI